TTPQVAGKPTAKH
ncbi:silent information regulator protein Sir2, partial [Enterococcus faecalis]